jgi:hypothetical protein
MNPELHHTAALARYEALEHARRTHRPVRTRRPLLRLPRRLKRA